MNSRNWLWEAHGILGEAEMFPDDELLEVAASSEPCVGHLRAALSALDELRRSYDERETALALLSEDIARLHGKIASLVAEVSGVLEGAK